MKARIESDGFIRIIAENPTEAFALKHLTPDTPCEHCDMLPMRIIIDNSVLNRPNPASILFRETS